MDLGCGSRHQHWAPKGDGMNATRNMADILTNKRCDFVRAFERRCDAAVWVQTNHAGGKSGRKVWSAIRYGNDS
jgi:hypothetical protein